MAVARLEATCEHPPTNMRRSIAALWLLLGCASGPHPALTKAARDFKCPIADLKRHEIYPNKQRIEGCNKEAVYVKDCSGYGTDSACQWAKAKAEF